jgi:hypothetical protein
LKLETPFFQKAGIPAPLKFQNSFKILNLVNAGAPGSALAIAALGFPGKLWYVSQPLHRRYMAGAASILSGTFCKTRKNIDQKAQLRGFGLSTID